jgi:hypothetical protein
MTSPITKMHDSLPLELFSPVTFAYILEHEMTSEMVLAPWCLLTAALTVPGFNTKTRCHLLEIGFWFLFYYDRLLAAYKHPRGVTSKITEGNMATLYTPDQLRDGINTFFSLITLIRTSPTAVKLDHLGSGPLEHAFGQGRIRCHDINTMNKMLAAFADRAESLVLKAFLDLFGTSHRRHSIGIICGPWLSSDPSVIPHAAYEIALSLLELIGLDLQPLTVYRQEQYPSWWDLKALPAFRNPMSGDALKGTVFMSFFSKVDQRGTGAQGGRSKQLCSDQLFLGIVKSPRPDLLNTAPSKMAKVLGTAYPDIEMAINTLYENGLTVRQLENRVSAIAGELHVDRPSGRAREDYFAWLDHYQPRSMELMEQLFSDPRSADG